MRDVVAIDPLNKQRSHIYFNASFLVSYQETLARFIADSAHVDQVTNIIGSVAASRVRTRKGSWGTVKVLVAMLKYCLLKRRQVFFLAFDNTICPLFMIIAFPFLFGNKLYIITHNNLRSWHKSKMKRALHRLMYHLYRMEVVVLTEEMKKVYEELIPKRQAKLVPHVNYSTIINYKDIPILTFDKLNIVLLGRHAKMFAPTLFGMDTRQFNNLCFTVVSTATTSELFHGLSDAKTNFRIIERRLNYDEYYSIIAQSDYVLFADDPSVYNRASGVLIDALSLRSSIIGPRTGHFEELNKFNIGFLYSNHEELHSIFLKINNDIIAKANFTGNIERALKYTTIQNWQKI